MGTNSPKAKQRLRDTVRDRIRSTEITHKASISNKAADDAAVEVSVPERTNIPSGDDSVWADMPPLLESACKGNMARKMGGVMVGVLFLLSFWWLLWQQ
ncbi:hypothetical protein SO802_025046 [Lithocarpus litseifolius]|uniref:Uncharacterized protein n=1 Tax=Lithocarpus litseifolius TaxID=425828 RepID=A0AAW2BVN0_9ROSI